MRAAVLGPRQASICVGRSGNPLLVPGEREIRSSEFCLGVRTLVRPGAKETPRCYVPPEPCSALIVAPRQLPESNSLGAATSSNCLRGKGLTPRPQHPTISLMQLQYCQRGRCQEPTAGISYSFNVTAAAARPRAPPQPYCCPRPSGQGPIDAGRRLVRQPALSRGVCGGLRASSAAQPAPQAGRPLKRPGVRTPGRKESR
jgi:hypothetical protein